MNAKLEFLEEIKGKKLICAKIGIDRKNYGGKIKWYTLKDSHTKEDLETFLGSLDFDYDDGFGSQELFGTILFIDSYSDRYEYDGSEHWENHKMPTIEKVLTPPNKL